MSERALLLVEDNEYDEEMALRVLLKMKLRTPVIVARDGEAALDYLFVTGSHAGRRHQPPRVVLLDLNLPKLSGLEVLCRIRADARMSAVPIVILTSSDEAKDVSGCYAGGANSYVVKPVEFEAFSNTLQQIAQYWIDVNACPLVVKRVTGPVRWR